MEYFDSCMTYVSKSTQTANKFNMNKIVFGRAEMGDDQIFSNLLSLSQSCAFVPMSLNVAVKNPVTMSGCIEKKMFRFEVLMQKLKNVLRALKYMGESCGFSHNDLHLGNILYDPSVEEFVIIDYGRLLMYENLMTENTRETARNHILMERLKSNEKRLGPVFPENPDDPPVVLDLKEYGCNSQPINRIGYSDYTFAWCFLGTKDIYETASSNGFDHIVKYMFMFDVMTLTIGAMKEMSKVTRGGAELYPEYTRFRLHTFFQTGLHHRTHRPYIKIRQLDYNSIMPTMRNDDVFPLLLGTYWLDLYVKYLIEVIPTGIDTLVEIVSYQDQLWYVIDTINMADAQLIFTSMQLLIPPEPLKFCQYIDRKQNEIEAIISLLTLRPTGGSAMKNKKSKPKKNLKRSLKMDVIPVSSSRYATMTRAYQGGGGGAYVEGDEPPACLRPMRKKAVPISELKDYLTDYIQSIGWTKVKWPSTMDTADN